MKSINFLKMLNQILSSEKVKEIARFKDTFFTRNRKLPFKDVLCVLLDMRKNALQARLNQFFRHTNQEVTMTEQAISKVRNQFDHSPFETMLRTVVAAEYSEENNTPTWWGYHLLAVDGSTAQVPQNPQTIAHFGKCGGDDGHACVSMSILYDVENNWVIDPIFTASRMNERAELLKHISFLSDNFPDLAKKSLMLLDRGYPSEKVFNALNQAGIKFLCRCSKSFSQFVNNAPAGDSIVEKNGLILRVYKFPLSTGEEETLITNEFDIDCSEFQGLYSKRWGIETAYHTLKSKLSVEAFSGKTVNSIYQDLWASMVLMNFVSVTQSEADEKVRTIRSKKNNKYQYTANTGALIVTLRDEFIFNCLRDNSILGSLRMEKIILQIARCVSPIRPDRSYPRKINKAGNKRFPVNSKSHL